MWQQPLQLFVLNLNGFSLNRNYYSKWKQSVKIFDRKLLNACE
jgi:hypothetical protein